MTEQLPISIDISDDLKQQFVKISAVGNKLEAQLNFQTMIANWYGDEDNLLLVQLCLETPQSFVAQQKTQQQLEVQTYSDDVFSYYEKTEKERCLICHVAITGNELAILRQEHKMLEALLRAKLQKVINLIANQLKLNTI
jgi:hypothetical protein